MRQEITSTFDAVASTFERYRSFPEEVPGSIREAIWTHTGLSGPADVLDIGAGTGRIGRAFVAAGDRYCGVDTSLAMLQEFLYVSANCTLTQADGSHLPFADGSFDIVLLMQVLSGADDWKGILKEARRAVRNGGSVVVGQTVSPEDGIDAQLKQHLKQVLRGMDVEHGHPEQSRRKALEWLKTTAERHVHAIAATWSTETKPASFLERHRTGARFSALPADVQKEALGELRLWAAAQFGSLDARFKETRTFELDIFTFHD